MAETRGCRGDAPVRVPGDQPRDPGVWPDNVSRVSGCGPLPLPPPWGNQRKPQSSPSLHASVSSFPSTIAELSPRKGCEMGRRRGDRPVTAAPPPPARGRQGCAPGWCVFCPPLLLPHSQGLLGGGSRPTAQSHRARDGGRRHAAAAACGQAPPPPPPTSPAQPIPLPNLGSQGPVPTRCHPRKELCPARSAGQQRCR